MLRLLASIGLIVSLAACAGQTPRSTSSNPDSSTYMQAQTCVVGEGIPYSEATFSIDNLVVDYGPGVSATMAEVQKLKGGPDTVYGEYSYPLYVAAKAGKVERFVGEELHRIYLGNVIDTSKVPDMVPYKSGWGRCAGMAKVVRLGPHTLEVTFPLRGGSGFGQGGVVFPRAPLQTRNLVVCSTAGVETLFVPQITKGPLRDLPNTLCAVQYQAGDRAISGQPAILFSFVAAARARSVKGVP